MGWAQQCFPGSVQAWRQATFPISQNCMPIRSLESLTKHNLTKEMLCPPFISGHGAEKRQTKGGKKSTQSSRKHCLRCSKIYYRLRKRHGIRWGTALVDKVTAVHQTTAQMLYSAWVLPSYQELSPFWEWVMSYREPPFSAPTGTRKEWGEKSVAKIMTHAFTPPWLFLCMTYTSTSMHCPQKQTGEVLCTDCKNIPMLNL